MKSKIIQISIVVAFIMAIPFIVWQLIPSTSLSVWILDKTVPNNDYREHKGLMWALNHFKILNKTTGKSFANDQDYFGFFPGEAGQYQIKDLPEATSQDQPQLIYLTDTYGVYSDDFQANNAAGTRSTLIYGGLMDQDVTRIQHNLKKGTTLIAEFNTMASPTSPATRKQMEAILSVEWKKWMGRYFLDLTSGVEVPVWMVNNYEKETGRKWEFTGPGIALVSDADQVVILESGKDFGEGVVELSFAPPYDKEMNVDSSIPYYYWFEFMQPKEGAEVLANYHMDVMPEGKKKLEKLGLTEDFPAIIRHKKTKYTSYYFAGDFADSNKVPEWYKIWGLDLWKKWAVTDYKGDSDAFYWRGYLPMMKKILQDVASTPITTNEVDDQVHVPIFEANGIKQVAKVENGQIALYDGKTWNPRFWAGMNLGATTPGHDPGELSPSKWDYLRWFKQMQEMNISVIRIYTILPPYFYEALAEYNRDKETPLYFFQGIWSPEEELIGEDEKGTDAYNESITAAFQKEIRDAVNVIHGNITIPAVRGHASGEYRTDVSAYMLGWIVGTEWYPYAVKATNDMHAGMAPYQGTYFTAKQQASPFESWLASMLDVLAKEEMKYGWQHPVSFTNWLTTDPLKHPNEPLEQEDLVPVDPMNIGPTKEWESGYFAAYHVYPYYPDFLRYEPKYQVYRDKSGKINPYAGYLHDLRLHHQGIPLIVAEFGVPSSRGMAHYGPLGKNQGMHTEKEQGEMNADMIRSMVDENLNGAILFAWQDEWFKFTWNTLDLELPRERRAMWRNRLTNEENFGVIAVEPGSSPDDMIQVDGKISDWEKRTDRKEQDYPQFKLSTTHDEAYLYLLLQKKQGVWNFANEKLFIGFDTILGGSQIADKAPGIRFPTGIEFLLQMAGESDSHIFVNSAFDQHTWFFSVDKKLIPGDPRYQHEELGLFLPWKLALNRGLYLPETNQKIPFEELEVGMMKPGISDPNDPAFNTLADWYVKENYLEIRIPWMLLGFTDPSSHQVWDNPYRAGEIKPVTTDGIKIEPILQQMGSTVSSSIEPTFYQWEKWNQPVYHERKKQSFDILRDVYAEFMPAK
ncbi:hypothetical protein [uncultured Brevibacillus sp.]|uniref:hypothetical protein n=1 Tax=uncultured Brevibacillus sp. TaxID=169970 RepID=UPI00259A6D9F|nr:hypothetical protein [uncultured Brevibacillus sp.]